MNDHETLTQCEQCGTYNDYRTMARVDAQGQESEEGRVLCLSCQKRQQGLALLQHYPNLVMWITRELKRSLDDVQGIEFERDMVTLPFEAYATTPHYLQTTVAGPFTVQITFTDGTTVRRMTGDTSLLMYIEPEPEPEITVLDLAQFDAEDRYHQATRSRKLDAAVATYVFRQKAHHDIAPNLSPDYVYVDTGRRVPLYSTDWNAAWLVYKEMRKGGEKRAFEEPLMLYHDGENAYGDEMYPAQEMFDIVDMWTPERICLAALNACHVEVVEETEHPA